MDIDAFGLSGTFVIADDIGLPMFGPWYATYLSLSRMFLNAHNTI